MNKYHMNKPYGTFRHSCVLHLHLQRTDMISITPLSTCVVTITIANYLAIK
jgi:hypothetical protein